jgi:hypothetical protein
MYKSSKEKPLVDMFGRTAPPGVIEGLLFSILVLFGLIIMANDSESSYEQLKDAIASGETVEVEMAPDQVSFFAPLAISGTLVFPAADQREAMAGQQREVLICLTGADGVMNANLGKWDGLRVIPGTLKQTSETVFMESCDHV